MITSSLSRARFTKNLYWLPLEQTLPSGSTFHHTPGRMYGFSSTTGPLGSGSQATAVAPRRVVRTRRRTLRIMDDRSITRGGRSSPPMMLSCDHDVRVPATSEPTSPYVMRALPDDVAPYKRTPEFTQDTVPAGLVGEHRTKPGVWGKIVVLEGRLRYHILEPAPETVE